MENPHPTMADKEAEAGLNQAPETHPSLSLAQRRAFMQLPLEERRRILAQQAEEMTVPYQQNTEWQEIQAGDIVEY